MRLLRRNPGGLAVALACLLLPAVAVAQTSKWVTTSVTGRLIYVPDPQGDRIQNFSMVGYGAGKRAIPNNIPVVVHIDPIAGDNTAHIQNAINAAAAMPLQANGYRGAVELGPGIFNVDGHLSITTSGIVLRGVGGGDNSATNTHIISQNRTDSISSASTPVINIQGSSSGTTRGTPINIIDKVVPVGAQSFRVASTTGMSVGGMVEIFRPSTQAWIEELGMDLIPPPATAWSAGDRDLDWQRTITRIEGNRVFIDAPITTALDAQWGGGTIRTYNSPNKIRNVGVENLRGQSLDTREETNELRTPSFIRFTRVDDGFVRTVETRHFPYASVITSEADATQHISVDGVNSRLPSGEVTGGRRYTFDMEGQYSLVKNSTADSGRHDFVTGSDVVGPIAFVDSSVTTARADSGPHHRWGNGLLFDNISVSGNAINVQNRWTSGTGHGWAGANVVIWNSTANSFIAQSPPTAQTWLIGSTGTINAGSCHLDAGVTCAGYYDSHGTKVTVGGTQSLYQAQVNDAADIREFHWTAASGSGNWNDHVKWNQEVKPGVYTVSTREYLVGDYDDYTNDGAVDNVFVDPAWQAAVGGTVTGLDNLTPDKNVAFTVQRQVGAGERVVHAYLAMSVKQGGDEVATDFVQLFDTQPENKRTFGSLGWSSQVNATTPFVGAIDLGSNLDRLQGSSVNVALSDDVGVDWVVYSATVATPIVDSAGPSVFVDGGRLTVDNVVGSIGTVQNSSAGGGELVLAPTGRLSIIDDYTQGAGGTLTAQINGDLTGQYGQVTANDKVNLAGALKLELMGGFMPSSGDAFTIASGSGGRVGTFATSVLPSLPGDLVWQLTYNTNTVVANVIGSIAWVGDLNGDSLISPVDWSLFKAGQGASFAGLTKMQSYLQGDLDGDLDHDLADFAAFRYAYDHANGAGAFSQLIGFVPEPASIWLFCLALAGLLGQREPRRADTIKEL